MNIYLDIKLFIYIKMGLEKYIFKNDDTYNLIILR